MSKIEVAIIDDNVAVLKLLKQYVNKSVKYFCEQTFTNAEDAIRNLPKHPVPIVLMDIQLPHKSGIECVAALHHQMPDTQFVMCTASDDDENIFEALKAGATGYLLKNLTVKNLHQALDDLQRGGAPITPSIARKVITAFSRPKEVSNKFLVDLSEREIELLNLLSEGLRYKEIADRLAISIDTVKKHCQNIYKKLHVQSRVDAVNKVFQK